MPKNYTTQKFAHAGKAANEQDVEKVSYEGSEDYWKEIQAKYGFTDKQMQLVRSNPEVGVDYSRGFLGLSAKKNKTAHERKINDWFANLATKFRDEDYNLPVNQVDRDRDAGLNSDLLGLSGSQAVEGPGASASEIEDDSGFSEFGTVAGSLLSLASLAIGFPEAIAAVNGANLINDAQAIDNARNLVGLVSDRFGDFPPVKDLSQDEITEAKELGLDLSQVLKAAQKTHSRGADLGKMFFKKQPRLAKQSAAVYDSLKNTLGAEYRSALGVRDLNSIKSDPNYNYPELVAATRKAVIDNELSHQKIEASKNLLLSSFVDNPEYQEKYVTEGLSDLEAKEAENKYRTSQAKFDKEVIDKLDPALKAQLTNTDFRTLTSESVERAAEAALAISDLNTIMEYESFLSSQPAIYDYSDQALFSRRSKDYNRARDRRERRSSRGTSPTDLIRIFGLLK